MALVALWIILGISIAIVIGIVVLVIIVMNTTDPCEDGCDVFEACLNSGCCSVFKACGTVCCADDETCVNQKCVTSTVECTEDSDCDDSKVCDNNGKCVTPTAECTEDSDCDDSKVCDNGKCVTPTVKCTGESGCDDTEVCVVDKTGANGACVESGNKYTLTVVPPYSALSGINTKANITSSFFTSGPPALSKTIGDEPTVLVGIIKFKIKSTDIYDTVDDVSQNCIFTIYSADGAYVASFGQMLNEEQTGYRDIPHGDSVPAWLAFEIMTYDLEKNEGVIKFLVPTPVSTGSDRSVRIEVHTMGNYDDLYSETEGIGALMLVDYSTSADSTKADPTGRTGRLEAPVRQTTTLFSGV